MISDLGAALMASGALSAALAIALWSTTDNTSANKYLAAVLTVLAGMISVYSLGWTGRVDVPGWLAFWPLNLPLALGPLLFGYVRALATGCGHTKLALHLAPAAGHFVYLCVVLALPDSVRAAWKDGPHDALIKPALEAAILASLTVYALAGLRIHRRYRAWLEQARSDADRYAARWIAGLLVTLIVTLIALVCVRLYTWFVAELEVGALYIWFGVWSTWLGVEGWRYSERRFPMMAPPSPVSAPSVESAEAAPGPGPDWADLGSAWQSRTQQEGWWREPDLTLADLARRLGTNTTYLSRAINEGLGLNFNELVNRMRAAETARLIEADAQANLVQIALEAGFSSKATFNRVFRAVYGHSPSEHRRLKSHISQGAQESEASNSSEIGKPAG